MDFESLEKLAELRQKGIITEEEFNLKKKEILNIQVSSEQSTTDSNISDKNKIQNNNFFESPYYQEEFKLIRDSNGEYRGKFNWYAFILNFVWYFLNGMPKHGVFLLIHNLIGTIILPVVGTFVFVFIFTSGDVETFIIKLYKYVGIDFYILWRNWALIVILSSSFLCGKDATFRYYNSKVKK